MSTSYVGQLVVLSTKWNVNSNRVGLVIGYEPYEHLKEVVFVLWTVKDGVKIKKHLQEALLPVTEETVRKIEERICNIK